MTGRQSCCHTHNKSHERGQPDPTHQRRAARAMTKNRGPTTSSPTFSEQQLDAQCNSKGLRLSRVTTTIRCDTEHNTKDKCVAWPSLVSRIVVTQLICADYMSVPWRARLPLMNCSATQQASRYDDMNSQLPKSRNSCVGASAHGRLSSGNPPEDYQAPQRI